MIKLISIVIAFIPSNLLFCQKNLPDTIFMKVYVGGDFRSELYGKGVKIEVDSLFFTFHQETNSYYSERLIKTSNLFARVNENFDERNINQDSTMSVFHHTWVSKEDANELLYWSSMANYESKILQQTIALNDSIDFIVYDTTLMKKGLNLNDFGIKQDVFIDECQRYNILNKKQIECSKMDFSKILESILNQNLGLLSVSSYYHYINLYYYLDDQKISLTQWYPKNMNIKWDIEIPTRQSVLNPHLNEIISKFLPFSLKLRYDLLEFKEYKNWIEIIDSSQN